MSRFWHESINNGAKSSFYIGFQQFEGFIYSLGLFLVYLEVVLSPEEASYLLCTVSMFLIHDCRNISSGSSTVVWSGSVSTHVLFDLVSVFWKRQKLVQAANGVETQVIDGKVEIENGNVPEDKPTEAEENDTISPFHIPSGWCMYLLSELCVWRPGMNSVGDENDGWHFRHDCMPLFNITHALVCLNQCRPDAAKKRWMKLVFFSSESTGIVGNKHVKLQKMAFRSCHLHNRLLFPHSRAIML